MSEQFERDVAELEARPAKIAPILDKPDLKNDPGSVPHYTWKHEPEDFALTREDFPTLDSATEHISALRHMDEPDPDNDLLGRNHWRDVLAGLHGEAQEQEAPEVTWTEPTEEAPQTEQPFQVDPVIDGQAQSLQRQYQELEHQASRINWQELAARDPARAQDAWRGVQLKNQQIQQAFAQVIHAHHQDGARYLGQVFASPEWNHAPEWNDAERRRLCDYLMELGATPQSIAAQTNPALFIEARRALVARDHARAKPKSNAKVKIRTKRKKQEKEKTDARIQSQNLRPGGFFSGVEKISAILRR